MTLLIITVVLLAWLLLAAAIANLLEQQWHDSVQAIVLGLLWPISLPGLVLWKLFIKPLIRWVLK